MDMGHIFLDVYIPLATSIDSITYTSSTLVFNLNIHTSKYLLATQMTPWKVNASNLS